MRKLPSKKWCGITVVKYRIKTDVISVYACEKWCIWWPFWYEFGWPNIHFSIESAVKHIERDGFIVAKS
jgi:hypothetical protein